MDCSVVVLCSVQKQLLFRSSWKPRIQKAQRAKAKFVISCSTVVPFQEETKPSSALQPNSEAWFLPGLGFGWGLSAASTSQRSRTLQEGIAGLLRRSFWNSSHKFRLLWWYYLILTIFTITVDQKMLHGSSWISIYGVKNGGTKPWLLRQSLSSDSYSFSSHHHKFILLSQLGLSTWFNRKNFKPWLPHASTQTRQPNAKTNTKWRGENNRGLKKMSKHVKTCTAQRLTMPSRR